MEEFCLVDNEEIPVLWSKEQVQLELCLGKSVRSAVGVDWLLLGSSFGA